MLLSLDIIHDIVSCRNRSTPYIRYVYSLSARLLFPASPVQPTYQSAPNRTENIPYYKSQCNPVQSSIAPTSSLRRRGLYLRTRFSSPATSWQLPRWPGSRRSARPACSWRIWESFRPIGWGTTALRRVRSGLGRRLGGGGLRCRLGRRGRLLLVRFLFISLQYLDKKGRGKQYH